MNRLTVIYDGTPGSARVIDDQGRPVHGITRAELTLTPHGCTGTLTIANIGVRVAGGQFRPRFAQFRRPRPRPHP